MEYLKLTINDLEPGDCLLYAPKGVYGKLIAFKTWHGVAHCECYMGNGYSVASRDGKGVGTYPVRLTELIYVLRPNEPFDRMKAYDWFIDHANGQKYDWWGLLRFVWTKKVSKAGDDKMFCSEFLTRFYRQGGLQVFNNEDADAIAPFQFLLTEKLTQTYPNTFSSTEVQASVSEFI
jgi:hypothetical protein